MTMLNELRLVDRIEQVHGERPYCVCGRETVTIYRDGAIWLECAMVHEPAGSRMHRIWNALSEPEHAHVLIADVPEPEALAA